MTRDYRKDPVSYILIKCKKRAKKKGIEFSLIREDIIFPEVCPIFKVPFNFNPKTEKEIYYGPSIDRIDCLKGYVPGNIRVISYLANVMMFTANEEERVCFARGILEFYGEA